MLGGDLEPPCKRFRGASSLKQPFLTFRDIRKDAYRKAEYLVDESWPFEEERPSSDSLLVPAFVLTNSLHFAKSVPAQPAHTITQELLWRCAKDGAHILAQHRHEHSILGAACATSTKFRHDGLERSCVTDGFSRGR